MRRNWNTIRDVICSIVCAYVKVSVSSYAWFGMLPFLRRLSSFQDNRGSNAIYALEVNSRYVLATLDTNIPKSLAQSLLLNYEPQIGNRSLKIKMHHFSSGCHVMSSEDHLHNGTKTIYRNKYVAYLRAQRYAGRTVCPEM